MRRDRAGQGAQVQALRFRGLSQAGRSGPVIAAVSAAAFAFLLWLLYGAAPAQPAPEWTRSLPPFNAACNAASAVCAFAGWLAIRAGAKGRHRACMLGALGFSTFFLLGYIAYHRFHGDTHFPGQGWVRGAYFFTLISHVLLSALALPLVLATAWAALSGAFERHRRLARWTLPLWLYVSLSGVAVYVFLRPYY